MKRQWIKICGVSVIDAEDRYIAGAENCVKIMDVCERETGVKIPGSGLMYYGDKPIEYDPMLDYEGAGEEDAKVDEDKHFHT